jgi:hypothetical protein
LPHKELFRLNFEVREGILRQNRISAAYFSVQKSGAMPNSYISRLSAARLCQRILCSVFIGIFVFVLVLSGFGIWHRRGLVNLSLKPGLTFATEQSSMQRLDLGGISGKRYIVQPPINLNADKFNFKIVDLLWGEIYKNFDHTRISWEHAHIVRYRKFTDFCATESRIVKVNYRPQKMHWVFALIHKIDAYPDLVAASPIRMSMSEIHVTHLASPILYNNPLHQIDFLDTRLAVYVSQRIQTQIAGPSGYKGIDCRDVYDDPFRSYKPWQRFFWGIILFAIGLGLGGWWRGEWDWGFAGWWRYLLALAGVIICCMAAGILSFLAPQTGMHSIPQYKLSNSST